MTQPIDVAYVDIVANTKDFRKELSKDMELAVKDIEKQSEDGKWKFLLCEGAEVDAKIVNSGLDEIGGNAKFQILDTEGPLLDGNVENAKIKMADMLLSGTATLATAREFSAPRSGEEMAPGFLFASVELAPAGWEPG